MRFIKTLGLSATLGMLLANTAFADPDKCPGAADIQAQVANKSSTVCNNGNCTFSLENHRYDTDLYWHFYITLAAGSTQEATSKAEDATKSLAYQSGPTEVKDKDDLWYCHYSNSYGYEAIAAFSHNKLMMDVTGE